MRARRAQARLCGRDARAPGGANLSCKLRVPESSFQAANRALCILSESGFTGFSFRVGGVFSYDEKRKPGEIEILKILILTNTRNRAPSGFPLSRE